MITIFLSTFYQISSQTLKFTNKKAELYIQTISEKHNWIEKRIKD
jgi:hypothetical protein